MGCRDNDALMIRDRRFHDAAATGAYSDHGRGHVAVDHAGACHRSSISLSAWALMLVSSWYAFIGFSRSLCTLAIVPPATAYYILF